jgi:hypothetical protein
MTFPAPNVTHVLMLPVMDMFGLFDRRERYPAFAAPA